MTKQDILASVFIAAALFALACYALDLITK